MSREIAAVAPECPLAFTPRRYSDITYPHLFAYAPIYWLWERWFCPRGWHLWDEVVASYSEHVLVCDACGLAFGHRGEAWEAEAAPKEGGVR